MSTVPGAVHFPQECIHGLIWRSEVGVLQKFCKSQTTKKGPPFGEPF